MDGKYIAQKIKHQQANKKMEIMDRMERKREENFQTRQKLAFKLSKDEANMCAVVMETCNLHT